jgi:hypothetical protein
MKIELIEHGLLFIEFTFKKKRHIMGHWVNAKQTKHERQFKYQFARLMGLTFGEANRIRDFTNSHFLLYLRARDKLVKK